MPNKNLNECNPQKMSQECLEGLFKRAKSDDQKIMLIKEITSEKFLMDVVQNEDLPDKMKEIALNRIDSQECLEDIFYQIRDSENLYIRKAVIKKIISEEFLSDVLLVGYEDIELSLIALAKIKSLELLKKVLYEAKRLPIKEEALKRIIEMEIDTFKNEKQQ